MRPVLLSESVIFIDASPGAACGLQPHHLLPPPQLDTYRNLLPRGALTLDKT